jgi:secreted trypsin-like serine protease
MRKNLLAVVVAALVALGLQAPAHASTQGTPDGETHPNVGLILSYSDDGFRYRCTATLIRADLLLTAAHCTDGVVGKVLVTFDSTIVEASTRPDVSPFPTADPEVGYTTAQLQAAGFESGDAYTDPGYSDFTDMKNWNDVGVVVLDRAVEGIDPAPLAGLNTLDRIKTSDLSKTRFTAVGYGTEVRKADSGAQKPTPMDYPLIRRSVDMYGQKLTPQILQTNGSTTNGKDTGTTCFGDSGGPVFLGGEIVAVTSYGMNEVCRGVSGYQRVDVKVAQDWIFGPHTGTGS